MATTMAEPLVGIPGTRIPLPDNKGIYSGRYRVKIRFRDRCAGGVPKDPNVQRKWLEMHGLTHEEAESYVQEVRFEVGDKEEYVQEGILKGWSGFRFDQHGLYLRDYQVKAMLRECATELKITTEKRGFRQRMQHGMFPKPSRLYFKKGDQNLTEADGAEENVVHTTGPRGPQSSFKKWDYVEQGEIEFEIWIVRQEFIQDDLARMLALAQEMGLGANRSQGEGKFDVVEFDRIW